MAKLRQLSSEPGEYSEAYAAQLKALELMNLRPDELRRQHVRGVLYRTAGCREPVESFGANGHGVALGFDSERIQAL